jgi:hypothetical protein
MWQYRIKKKETMPALVKGSWEDNIKSWKKNLEKKWKFEENWPWFYKILQNKKKCQKQKFYVGNLKRRENGHCMLVYTKFNLSKQNVVE